MPDIETVDSQDSALRRAMNSTPARLSLGLLLITCGVLCFAFTDEVAQYSGQEALSAEAESLVDDSLAKNQQAFLVLSGIKAALALVEGSSVGVGFSLEIGDVVQPAYDYVHFFWLVFLVGFVIMGTYKILLETGMLELGLMLAGAGLIVASVGLCRTSWQKSFHRTARWCILFGVLVAFIVPTALVATHYLSDHYTSSLRDKYGVRIAAFQMELDRTQAELLGMKEEVSLLSPVDSLAALKARAAQTASTVMDAFNASFYAFIYYIILLMFDMLFFPLVTALVLFKFMQLGLNRILLETGATVPPPAPTFVPVK
jgi:hypothetical protein